MNIVLWIIQVITALVFVAVGRGLQLGGTETRKRNVAILGYESKKRRGFSAKTSL